jgi:hypothetical protein
MQRRWPLLIADPEVIRHGDIDANPFLIDFGQVREMMAARVPAEDIGSHLSELQNRIVIIGRATPGEAYDSFNTTAFDQPIPGIYAHAAAVETLMGAPLFTFTDTGRRLIDLITTLYVLGCEALVFIILDSMHLRELGENLLIAAPTVLAILLVAAGFYYVDLTGIYWTDFLLVGLILIIGTQAEAIFKLALKVVQKSHQRIFRSAMTSTTLCMLAIGLGAAGALGEEAATVGVIQSVSGSVYLRPFDAPAESAAIPLSPRRDLLRPLHDGDQLQALRDGEVRICLLSGKPRILRAKDGPVRLHPLQTTTDQERALSSAILQFGKPGASREVAPLLWFPAADSWILAQDFRLRWNPPHAAETFSVTVLRDDGTRLWSVDAVDSSQGGLSSQQEVEVAGLLQRERSQSARQRYSVMITSDRQGAPKTSFAVVSSTEEAQVTASLARWDQAALDPLVRALSRAETWRAANLMYKTAEEYDRALTLAPESVALLEADLAAHRQIGDLTRSQELANRLRDLTSE